MSQIYFSKLNPEEKKSRLQRLGSSNGNVVVWLKGQKDRYEAKAVAFYPDENELVAEFVGEPFPFRTVVLCTFDLNGATYLGEAENERTSEGRHTLRFKKDLFKAERRSSYRLLTFPIYNVWLHLNLGEAYEGGNVVNLKSKTSQTGLFKNFLKLVNPDSDVDSQIKDLKIRVQDLSTTGLAIHIGDLEAQFLSKDMVFQDITVSFPDEEIVIPELKVVYIVDYIGTDRHAYKYKVGIHFSKMDHITDDKLGRKISSLLRENDLNQDFENFLT